MKIFKESRRNRNSLQSTILFTSSCIARMRFCPLRRLAVFPCFARFQKKGQPLNFERPTPLNYN